MTDVKKGTRVTCEDLANGKSESTVIRDDFLLVTDGNAYLDGVQAYPGTGTTVLTIKRHRPEGAKS